MAYLLGLDIGTTTLKCVLYDASAGKVLRVASRPTPVDHPRKDWSEHQPESLWKATADCIREAAEGQQVQALAISSMAEAGLLVDRDMQPISSIIAWYDRRSEPQAAWIEEQTSMTNLYEITGQRASPSFGITKILWHRENEPENFSQAQMWLPVPSYLLWKLTGQLAVDYTIAARTLLFDQRMLDWSAELLNLFGLPKTFLPRAGCGGTPIGGLSQSAADITGLSPSTVCVLGGHDHLCATLATGAHHTGSMTDSTGSANALLLLLPDFHPKPALAECGYASYAYVLPRLYALKGGLKAAGSAIEWLARQLSPSGQNPDYARLEASALEGAGRRAGPIWLPHLIGSGTPQGDRFSRAALVGAQFEHSPGDLFRGMLESLAFWTRQNFDEMQALTGTRIQSLTLTGGVTRLVLLSQLKADVLNRPVRVTHVPEAAAAGAALLAGIGSGVFESASEALDSLHYEWEEVEPHPERAKWYAALYENAYLPLYDALKNVNHALNQVQGTFQEPTDG